MFCFLTGRFALIRVPSVCTTTIRILQLCTTNSAHFAIPPFLTVMHCRYKTVIVIPETQSQEKKDMLRICGAELVEVPAVPYKNPNNYVKYSRRLAEELARTQSAGAVWCAPRGGSLGFRV